MTIKSSALTLIGLTFLSIPVYANGLTPLVCQNKKCLPASQAVTIEYLYNRVQQLFKKNSNYSLFLCEANPNSKMCLKNGISFPIKSGNYQTMVEIPSAKLLDVSSSETQAHLDLILDYKIKAGNLFPTCQTASTSLNIFDSTAMEMQAPLFTCSLTQSTKAPLNLFYQVDYIDFDTGTIGAFYSANTGTAQGYLTLRFSQPGPTAIADPFPMPEVQERLLAQAQAQAEALVQAQAEAEAQFQMQVAVDTPLIEQEGIVVAQETDEPHTQMDPIWMKPTPLLSLQEPIVDDKPCTDSLLGGCSKSKKNDVVSTTGLIFQDKKVIPSENGVKKTVTVTKRIIEDGQALTKTNTQSFEVLEEEHKKAVTLDPKELKPVVQELTVSQPETIQISDPHEIVLSDNELIPVDGQPYSIQGTEDAKGNAPTKIGQNMESLWDKLEKYFYF